MNKVKKYLFLIYLFMGITIADTIYTYLMDGTFHSLYIASALIIGGSGIEAIRHLKQQLHETRQNH